MDEPEVTWEAGRKGWMGRPRREVPPPPVPPPVAPVPVDVPPVVAPPIVIVPPFPCFSPAAIAALLRVYRSNVQYWMESGKLDSFKDNIGVRYVLRDELIRFVREFLGWQAHE